jgi:hypothetical protein
MAKRWKDLTQKYRKSLAAKARGAALEVLNDLIDISPGYSGAFIDSWTVTANGKRQRADASGVPIIDVSGRSADIRNFAYKIFNTSDHALEAMDLVPGLWITPSYDPIKPFLVKGKRYGRDRTAVASGDGDHGYTAEANWWENYVKNAGFKNSVAIGFNKRTGIIKL